MSRLWRDLQFSLRSLLRVPVFTLVAVLTLALGLGITTSVFSIVSGTLINGIPWERADRSVSIQSIPLAQDAEGGDVASGVYRDWAEQATAFEAIEASEWRGFNLTDRDDFRFVQGAAVTVNGLRAFGIRPLLGDVFHPEDGEPGRPRVAMLSEGLWQRRYGSDPALVGGVIEIDDQPVTVRGILRNDQYYPWPFADMLEPLRLGEAALSRTTHTLEVTALLPEGVSLEHAQSEMDLIAQRLAQAYPETDAGWRVHVQYLSDALYDSRSRAAIWIMGAAVLFVLLIVCANLANLLLTRGAGRQKEIATRSAVGATRAQLSLQLITESLVIALLALPVGLLLARWAMNVFMTSAHPQLGWLDRIFRFDTPVIVFSVVASLGTVLVFGLIPALQASRFDLAQALEEGGGRGASASGRPLLRAALAVSQIGVAIFLLATAALLIQSFQVLETRDRGFETERLLVANVTLPPARYPEPQHWRDFQRSLLARVESLPEVESAATINFPPFGYPGNREAFSIEGQPRGPGEETPAALWANVSAGYFAALGLRVQQGRLFDSGDREAGAPVAVINATLARRYFGAESPLGRYLEILGQRREIVGVVDDYRNAGLRLAPAPQVFEPYAQTPWASMGIVMRTRGEPYAAAAGLRTQLRGLDPLIPTAAIETMEERVELDLWTAQFFNKIMTALAAVALVLAALGVYGVLSFSAGQRTHEFGIRSALGAEPGQIAGLVLRQATLLVSLGVILGLVLTLLARGPLAFVLYGVSPFSVANFAGVALLLSGVALVASALPALRATRADPMLALRAE